MKSRDRAPRRTSGGAHERERPEEVLAELPVGHPRSALGPPFERQRIDEDRRRADELEVVGAGVLQHHAVLDGEPLDRQRRQGRALQLTEGPLERVRDERNRLRREDAVAPLAVGRVLNLVVADEQSALGERPVEAGVDQLVVVGGVAQVDLAQEPPLPAKHVARRIAERPANRRHVTRPSCRWPRGRRA